MTSFLELQNDVFLALEGWGLQQGRATWTTGSLTTSTLTFNVGDGDQLNHGVAEIDDELIYISAVNTNAVTVAADGRGYRGTTAATHASGARVTMNPLLPKTVVKTAINNTIQGTYPTLKVRASTDFTFNGSQTTYELPAACDQVISVSYDAGAPEYNWPQVYAYRVDHNADDTDFPSGKSLTLNGYVEPGRTVRVTYLTNPTALSANADQISASGLADTARACIVAGACWRLSSYLAASRVRVDSTAIDMMEQGNPIEAANRVTAYLRQQYEVELAEERRRQDLSLPPSISFTG